jgi:hypothetical protein
VLDELTRHAVAAWLADLAETAELTWDLLSRVMPRDSTSFSIRRVETPSR